MGQSRIFRPDAPRIIDAPKRYAERVDISTRNFRKWKARPGMFGNKGNERGDGIHQPPPVERNIIFVAQMGDTKTV